MTKKHHLDQPLTRRSPHQARAIHKVGLMLEAAMQLLEDGDLRHLTTNAVAARAGVSIGTLYQYFKSKDALLDALAAREFGAMQDKIVESLQGGAPAQPGDRIRRVVRAVTGAYEGRSVVHRRLIEYSLSHGTSDRLPGLQATLMATFMDEGITLPDQPVQRMTEAQAFVLTHAMAGVLRALASSSEAPQVQQVEDALVGLVLGRFAGA
jgi:AcrR family transcriptional regulator